MATPKEKSIKSAHKAGDYLADLFAKIGVGNHPRGIVRTAYRNSRRAMIAALDEGQFAVQEVMAGARSEIRDGLRSIYADAQEQGWNIANSQLGYYGVDPVLYSRLYGREALDGALDAVSEENKKQEMAILALLLFMNFEKEQIVGSDNRAGIMQEGAVLGAASSYAATVMWSSYSQAIEKSGAGDEFVKIASAVIDDRTTDCCRLVNGQVQPLDQPFILTGTPRFADRMQMSPFHLYCRTGIAIVRKADV